MLDGPQLYRMYTYGRSSACQLRDTCVNHYALVTADHNYGVPAEAEPCHCQQRASCEDTTEEHYVVLFETA